MVEAEAPSAAEEPQQEADGKVEISQSAEAPTSPGEMSLKPPKRLPKPDRDMYKQKEEAMHSTIRLRKARILEINNLLDGKRNQADSPQLVALKNKQSALRAAWDAELNKKQQLRGELEKVSQARKDLRTQARDMKTKMAYLTSGSKIDEQIAALEHRLAHSSMPLTEEKKTMEDIKKLKASRATCGAYEERIEKLASDDKLWNDIKEQMSACDGVLDSITKKQDAVRAEMKALRDKESERASDVPALMKERDECRAIVTTAWETHKAMKQEFKELNDVYWEAEQEFHAWRKVYNERRQKQWEEEQAAKDKEFQAQRAEMAGEHFNKEVTMCEQLTCYLGKFVSSNTAAAAAAGGEARVVAPDGMKVHVKKYEDADDVMGLSAAKRGAKKGKKGAAARSSDKATDAKLVHSLDIIASFAALNVEVPLTAAKVPAALDTIAARKEHYLAKRAELKESGVLPGTEGLAGAKAATANGHGPSSSGKGKAAVHANGYSGVGLQGEDPVQVKLQVKPSQHVAVAFKVVDEAFPSLA